MKNISFYIIELLFLFLPQFIHAQTTDTDVNSFLDKAEKELYTNPQQAAYYACNKGTSNGNLIFSTITSTLYLCTS